MKKTDFPEHLIVTGTDTAIGKTLVSAVLVAGLSAVYWKPVQSGIEGQTDRRWVREKTGLGDDHFPPEACLLRAPVSPHLAAAMEGVTIDLARIVPPALPPGISHMIIEGAGGVLAPLNDRHFMIDLFQQLHAPALVVATSRVGMINHTLLTVEQLRCHGIPVFGVVMNGPRNNENLKAVEHYGRVPVIGEIEPLPEITPEVLIRTFDNCFD
jgi:dethiobiotin synthase